MHSTCVLYYYFKYVLMLGTVLCITYNPSTWDTKVRESWFEVGLDSVCLKPPKRKEADRNARKEERGRWIYAQTQRIYHSFTTEVSMKQSFKYTDPTLGIHSFLQPSSMIWACARYQEWHKTPWQTFLKKSLLRNCAESSGTVYRRWPYRAVCLNIRQQ